MRAPPRRGSTAPCPLPYVGTAQPKLIQERWWCRRISHPGNTRSTLPPRISRTMWAPRRCRLKSGNAFFGSSQAKPPAPPTSRRWPALVGHALACQRPLAGAFLHSLSAAVVLLLLSVAFLMRGELEPWVQHIPSGPAIAALFRGVPMPGGTLPILLPPAETRTALTKLISDAPRSEER